MDTILATLRRRVARAFGYDGGEGEARSEWEELNARFDAHTRKLRRVATASARARAAFASWTASLDELAAAAGDAFGDCVAPPSAPDDEPLHPLAALLAALAESASATSALAPVFAAALRVSVEAPLAELSRAHEEIAARLANRASVQREYDAALRDLGKLQKRATVRASADAAAKKRTAAAAAASSPKRPDGGAAHAAAGGSDGLGPASAVPASTVSSLWSSFTSTLRMGLAVPAAGLDGGAAHLATPSAATIPAMISAPSPSHSGRAGSGAVPSALALSPSAAAAAGGRPDRDSLAQARIVSRVSSSQALLEALTAGLAEELACVTSPERRAVIGAHLAAAIAHSTATVLRAAHEAYQPAALMRDAVVAGATAPHRARAVSDGRAEGDEAPRATAAAGSGEDGAEEEVVPGGDGFGEAPGHAESRDAAEWPPGATGLEALRSACATDFDALHSLLSHAYSPLEETAREMGERSDADAGDDGGSSAAVPDGRGTRTISTVSTRSGGDGAATRGAEGDSGAGHDDASGAAEARYDLTEARARWTAVLQATDASDGSTVAAGVGGGRGMGAEMRWQDEGAAVRRMHMVAHKEKRIRGAGSLDVWVASRIPRTVPHTAHAPALRALLSPSSASGAAMALVTRTPATAYAGSAGESEGEDEEVVDEAGDGGSSHRGAAVAAVLSTPDWLARLLQGVSIRDLAAVACTCRAWHGIVASSPQLWLAVVAAGGVSAAVVHSAAAVPPPLLLPPVPPLAGGSEEAMRVALADAVQARLAVEEAADFRDFVHAAPARLRLWRRALGLDGAPAPAWAVAGRADRSDEAVPGSTLPLSPTALVGGAGVGSGRGGDDGGDAVGATAHDVAAPPPLRVLAPHELAALLRIADAESAVGGKADVAALHDGDMAFTAGPAAGGGGGAGADGAHAEVSQCRWALTIEQDVARSYSAHAAFGAGSAVHRALTPAVELAWSVLVPPAEIASALPMTAFLGGSADAAGGATATGPASNDVPPLSDVVSHTESGTFSEHAIAWRQSMLRAVLRALAASEPTIRYTQGLNFLARYVLELVIAAAAATADGGGSSSDGGVAAARDGGGWESRSAASPPLSPRDLRLVTDAYNVLAGTFRMGAAAAHVPGSLDPPMPFTAGLAALYAHDSATLQLRLYQFDRLLARHTAHLATHLKREAVSAAAFASSSVLTLGTNFAALPLRKVSAALDALLIAGWCGVLAPLLTAVAEVAPALERASFETLMRVAPAPRAVAAAMAVIASSRTGDGTFPTTALPARISSPFVSMADEAALSLDFRSTLAPPVAAAAVAAAGMAGRPGGAGRGGGRRSLAVSRPPLLPANRSGARALLSRALSGLTTAAGGGSGGSGGGRAGGSRVAAHS